MAAPPPPASHPRLPVDGHVHRRGCLIHGVPQTHSAHGGVRVDRFGCDHYEVLITCCSSPDSGAPSHGQHVNLMGDGGVPPAPLTPRHDNGSDNTQTHRPDGRQLRDRFGATEFLSFIPPSSLEKYCSEQCGCAPCDRVVSPGDC